MTATPSMTDQAEALFDNDRHEGPTTGPGARQIISQEFGHFQGKMELL